MSRTIITPAVLWAAMLANAGFAGCRAAGREGDLYQRLQSDNPSVRITAIAQAGREKDAQSVPLLVDRLEDDDADVRLFAQQALDRITGQSFGYSYYAAPAERLAAVERWRAWLADSVDLSAAKGGR